MLLSLMEYNKVDKLMLIGHKFTKEEKPCNRKSVQRRFFVAVSKTNYVNEKKTCKLPFIDLSNI
jgi:hypothetical protein